MTRRLARLLARALRSARGAIDLASIMVAVIVAAIVGAVVAASIFAVIPWAGEHAAKQDLESLTAAETVYFARASDDGVGRYVTDFNGVDATAPTLDTVGLVRHNPAKRVSVITNWDGSAFVARSIAPSGTRYYATSGSDTADAPAGAALPSKIRAFAKTHLITLWSNEPADSAFAEMWSWGNSVDHAVDARGEGRGEMLPAVVATFAKARHLQQVHVSVPWAADSGGPITDWVSQTVSALHGVGIKATALGGGNDWISDPSLAAAWINAGRNAAPFDSVELDIEPWAGNSGWRSNPSAIAAFTNMLTTARNAAHDRGLTLGLDIPWWFATTPYNGGTILDTVQPLVDRGVIVAFSDHAEVKNGQDGIIALARPAAEALDHDGIPFTVGVETDTAAVAGGNEFTFAEEGEQTLEDETAKVADAFASLTRFRGIAVEHYRAWASLPN